MTKQRNTPSPPGFAQIDGQIDVEQLGRRVTGRENLAGPEASPLGQTPPIG